MNQHDVQQLVEAELTTFEDAALRERARALLVAPYAVEREWDYGPDGTTYVCWTVLEHPPSNTALVYCEQGFGPAFSWGVLFLTGPHVLYMGNDTQWWETLEEAARQTLP